MTITVTALHRYPVKSCRGESMARADVQPWGLAGDRRWMVVDGDGLMITAREANDLLLVRPTITENGLSLDAADLDRGIGPIDVATPHAGAGVPVSIWSSELSAAPAGPDADAWFSTVLRRPARLVWLDDPARRPTDDRFGDDADRVSFADGYPLLLTTEESLAALEEEILWRAPHGRDPLPMARFRPNVVLRGAAAWSEDDWRRLRIGGPGGVVFRAVKACSRCVMTTLDPDTAVREKEPIAALARIRKWDGRTWFGVNLVPDPASGPATDLGSSATGAGAATTTGRLAVGDDVEVLESVPSGGGPLRAPERNPVASAP